MTDPEIEMMQRVASKAAAIYRERLKWRDHEELAQEAWVEMMRARRLHGEPLDEPLAWLIATRAILRHIEVSRAPVRVSGTHRPSKREAIRAVYGQEITPEIHDAILDEAPNPEEALAACQWAAVVSRRLTEILDHHGQDVADVIYRRRSGRSCADRINRSLETVYARSAQARREIRRDRRIQKLWRDR